MDQYVIPKEISSEMKFTKRFYLFDIVTLMISAAIAWLFSDNVYPKLIPLYYIFVFSGTFFLVMKNKFNPQKRNYQTIYYAFRRDRVVYTRF